MSLPRPIARLVPAIAKKAVAKRDLVLGRLIIDWPDIIGRDLSERTMPVRLAGGKRHNTRTLEIRCDGGTALDLQHDTLAVLERINTYLGHNAIGRLKIVQAAKSDRKRRVRRPPDGILPAPLSDMINGVDDADLRESLVRLGKTVHRRDQTDAAQ